MKYTCFPISAFVALAFLITSATSLHAKADRAAEAKKSIAAKKAAEAKGKNKKGDAPTPVSLVTDMQKAVAFIAKSAAESKPVINVKGKQARPFWSGLKTISEGLTSMQAGIKAKDEGMVDGLEDVGSGMTTLATTWGVIRAAYPKSQVGRGVIALSEAYNVYLHHYGPAVARYKKGGKVLDEEAEEVAKAHAQLEKLSTKLAALEGKAKKNSYQQRMVVDLMLLVGDLLDVKATSVKNYCKFVYQWDRLENALNGYNDIVEVWYPDFYTQWEIIADDTEAIGGLFVDNNSYYTGWNYTTESVKNYGVYYEKTAAVVSVSVAQVSSYEASVEAWSEESATEESVEESEEINEEVEIDEEEEHSLFEEVEHSEDDHDGDGVLDEDDDDDDNDGVLDEDDDDDDGDGIDDADDDEDDDNMQDDDDDDDDGIDDDDEDDGDDQ